MAYAAKCDTAIHTKWWVTGTGSSINRLSEVMDDNASGVEENDNPGNYQPWSEFMTEVVEDRIYQFHQNLEVGDGSTSTTLTSAAESVLFDSGIDFIVKSNATLQIGTLTGDWADIGSYWAFEPDANNEIISDGQTGIFKLYGSALVNLKNAWDIKFYGGTVDIRNSVLEGNLGTSKYTFGGSVDFSLRDVIFRNLRYVDFRLNPTVAENIHAHNMQYGAFVNGNDTTFDGMRITNPSIADLAVWSANTITMKDPVASLGTLVCNNAASVIKEVYTCNIHVADKDGANLSGVVVDCEDTDGTAVWTAGSVTTDANGDITEQTITYKTWTGTSETLKTYSPHKFTISKAGYKTFVLDNITINSVVDWYFELPDIDINEMQEETFLISQVETYMEEDEA